MIPIHQVGHVNSYRPKTEPSHQFLITQNSSLTLPQAQEPPPRPRLPRPHLPGVAQDPQQHQRDQWVSPRGLHLPPPLPALAGCPARARTAALRGGPGPPPMGAHGGTLPERWVQSSPGQARLRAR
uniref:Uncharacterized protein n=1 Tax=Spermophilus dauricus TaxID=99837 RepID=A0A8C9Q604_SPEDA